VLSPFLPYAPASPRPPQRGPELVFFAKPRICFHCALLGPKSAPPYASLNTVPPFVAVCLGNSVTRHENLVYVILCFFPLPKIFLGCPPPSYFSASIPPFFLCRFHVLQDQDLSAPNPPPVCPPRNRSCFAVFFRAPPPRRRCRIRFLDIVDSPRAFFSALRSTSHRSGRSPLPCSGFRYLLLRWLEVFFSNLHGRCAWPPAFLQESVSPGAACSLCSDLLRI